MTSSSSAIGRDEKKSAPIVLTVYFGATGERITQELINRFDDHQYFIGFDGVDAIGVPVEEEKDEFTFATAFAVGLDGQCRQVEKTVQDLQQRHPNQQIIVNCFGRSRGALGAMLAVQKLAPTLLSPYNNVTTNLGLIDPIPGNTRLARFLDFFNWTLANQAMDLTKCKNLKRAYAIYNTDSRVFYSAIAPNYPDHLLKRKDDLKEVIIPGNHLTGDALVEDFIEKCGTNFKTRPSLSEIKIDSTSKAINTLHSDRPIEIPIKKVKTEAGDIELQENSKWKAYFLIALKWLLLGAIIALALYFSGGLAAIPLLKIAVAELGLLSLPVILPVTTMIGRYIVSPIGSFLSQAASRIFYYFYKPNDDRGHGNELLIKSNFGTQPTLMEKIRPQLSALLHDWYATLIEPLINTPIYFINQLIINPIRKICQRISYCYRKMTSDFFWEDEDMRDDVYIPNSHTGIGRRLSQSSDSMEGSRSRGLSQASEYVDPPAVYNHPVHTHKSRTLKKPAGQNETSPTFQQKLT